MPFPLIFGAVAKLNVFVLRVLIPLFLGGFIYWQPYFTLHFHFIRNYLPDGLWAFALLSSLYLVWNGRPDKLWLTLAFLCFPVFEWWQAQGLVSGTADLTDVIIYVTFALFSIYLHENEKNKYETTE